jgi:hypothetical protein
MGSTERFILRTWLAFSLVAMTWLIYKEVSRASISRFETIEAKRINIREADGTLRMVIANTEKQDPGSIDGLTIHEPGTRPAGLLFFNEHGDEMGGLIYKGVSKDDVGGSLTFDRWKNDQTIQILYNDSEKDHTSGVIVSDRPNDDSMLNVLKQQKEFEKLQGDERKDAEAKLIDDIKNKKIILGTTRVFAGVKNGVAQYALYSSDGKLKVRISADTEGPGKIEMFDKDGKAILK